MAAGGIPPTEISKLYDSVTYKGLIEGDVINGTIPCGAGIGLIKEITSASEVVKEIVNKMETDEKGYL
jgi:NAD(P)H-dependent flavin oxidoreductase YrpB (nitropropane dioxygenase family)